MLLNRRDSGRALTLLVAAGFSCAETQLPPYPVPTSPDAKAIDCSVRSVALDFARAIQPRFEAPDESQALCAALQLEARCGSPCSSPTPTQSTAANSRPSPSPSGHEFKDQALSFYVNAATGQDTASGTQSQPFATIGRGLAACRTARTAVPHAVASETRLSRGGQVTAKQSHPPRSLPEDFDGGCTVLLADAAPYVLTAPLALTPADSNLTIKPDSPSGAPIVTGAVGVGPWSPHNLTGGLNIWKAPLPEGVPSSGAVYVHSRRAVLARWPNVADPVTTLVPEGYTKAASWLRPTPRPPPIEVSQPNATRRADLTFPDWWWGREAPGSPPTFDPPEGYWLSRTPAGGATYAVPSGLVYDPEDFSPRASGWANASTGRIHAFHGVYWGSWVFTIGGHTPHPNGSGVITFSGGGSQEARGNPYGGALFVEGIKEELDFPGEYFIDETANEIYLFYNDTSGTPPPANAVAVASLETLMSIAGDDSSSARVSGVTLINLTFTGSVPTFTKSFKAPSGGDWSFANTAAVVVEGTQDLTVDQCSFTDLGGNGLLLRGWTRRVVVQDSLFDRLGDSAIVTCGESELANLSSLQVVANTIIQRNVFRNMGIEVKQAGGVYSALSANHSIIDNVFYNGPRAGININDGAHGGHLIEGNLFFNLVRETGDHGAFNSWDREPYIQTWRLGARTPMPSHLRRNLFINTHYGIHSLDHDDGSNAFVDTGNVVAFAGMKNYLGFAKNLTGNLFVRPDVAGAAWTPPPSPNTIPLPKAYYFPYCARSLGQKNWGESLADIFSSNTCVLNSSRSVYEFGSCDPTAPSKAGNVPLARGNTFYTAGGNASFGCGKATLTIPQAQAVGYELGSISLDSANLSPPAVGYMIKAMLEL